MQVVHGLYTCIHPYVVNIGAVKMPYCVFAYKAH